MSIFGGDPSMQMDFTTEYRKQYPTPASATPAGPLLAPVVSNVPGSSKKRFGNSQPPPPQIGFEALESEVLQDNNWKAGSTTNTTTMTSRAIANKFSTYGSAAAVSSIGLKIDKTESKSFSIGGSALSLQPKYVIVTDQLRKNLTGNSSNKYTAIFHTSFSPNDYHQPSNKAPPPPFSLDWKWSNSFFVRVPLSSQNRTRDGTPKWDIIQQELAKLKSLCDVDVKNENVGSGLGRSINIYNRGVGQGSNFKILNNDPNLQKELQKLLPIIVDYAMKLVYLLGEPIPKLKRGESRTIYVTRELGCSLMAHCFLCTIPHEGRDDDMPIFHFSRLFQEDEKESSRSQIKKEKIKCIFNYFSQMARIGKEEGNKIISFERRSIRSHLAWGRSDAKLCPFRINSRDGIESANDHLQVDFANKTVGGGVLSDGSVMEEIRFSICPELILARLFTEPLEDDEVMVITGTKQFSLYSGYQSTFRFEKGTVSSPHHSQTDGFGRETTQVVVMDALHFTEHSAHTQYQKRNVDRELHKCYVAFTHGGKHVTPVATGNWGCGVFNGDNQLKTLLQWMAASAVERPGITFHVPDEQGASTKEIGEFLQKRRITVGKLYKALLKYEGLGRKRPSLFSFLFQTLN